MNMEIVMDFFNEVGFFSNELRHLVALSLACRNQKHVP